MYERLLVAIDHSPITERVLAAARELARLSGGEVWVVHTRERDVISRAGGLMDIETTDEAQLAVDAAVATLAEAGVKAHGEVRHAIYGYAAREIIDSAREHDASVIVMGSKGHGDLAGLLVGSTAHKVIHLSDRAVLVVR